MEEKTTYWSECLHFPELDTRGQPRDLVHSCQHLPLGQGYHRATDLLAKHFGNEHKIASAYMERILSWTPVKSEDVKALQSFLIFKGCSIWTEQIMYMKELDLPSNMRSTDCFEAYIKITGKKKKCFLWSAKAERSKSSVHRPHFYWDETKWLQSLFFFLATLKT